MKLLLTSIYLMHYCNFKGRCSYIPCFRKLSSYIALQRCAPTRGTACVWHTNCICSPHHHMHRCFPETAAVCHHSAPTHPLYIGFTALLGIAIATFWSIYLIFCKGNAHRVLLPGDQQFQFISFQTCFYSVREWKAHLLRTSKGWYFAKLLTWRRPPTLAQKTGEFYTPETRNFDP